MKGNVLTASFPSLHGRPDPALPLAFPSAEGEPETMEDVNDGVDEVATEALPGRLARIKVDPDQEQIDIDNEMNEDCEEGDSDDDLFIQVGWRLFQLFCLAWLGFTFYSTLRLYISLWTTLFPESRLCPVYPGPPRAPPGRGPTSRPRRKAALRIPL